MWKKAEEYGNSQRPDGLLAVEKGLVYISLVSIIYYYFQRKHCQVYLHSSSGWGTAPCVQGV